MDLQNIALNFIKTYGYMGVFVVGFSQSIIQPVPVLPFILFSHKIGLNPWIVALVGLISNILGAVVAYFLGFYFGEKIGKKFISEKHYIKAEAFFNKYGIWTILIGEPYKVICWMSGILKLSFYRFLIATTISRIFHTLLYIFIGHISQKIF